jgi:hypothetical protein
MPVHDLSKTFPRPIHIARALTYPQLTTLLCGRLDPLRTAHPIGLVILQGPCTTFFGEEVPFKDAYFLFQRARRKIQELRARDPLLLMAQELDRQPRRIPFSHALVAAVEVGIRVHTQEGCRHVHVVKPSDPRTRQPPEVAQHG